MTYNTINVAGIDTGKAKLDIVLSPGGQELQVDNTPDGHIVLSDWLNEHRVTHAGIEASGGYEAAIVAHLRARDIAITRFQPAQVRSYAGYRLQRAKNDKIDARMIAACTRDAEPTPQHDQRFAAFAEQLTWLEQIEDDLTRAKTRAEAFRHDRQRELIAAEIARLKQLRSAEIRALVKAVRDHKDLAHRLTLIQSIEGIGERTALAILIRMPEIGTLSREQVASLAGLAPFDHESGKCQRSRRIFGGRERLRRSLYAAALPAAFQWNEALIGLYQRLTAAGKPHKIAMIACARKLLIYANTVVKRDQPWIAKHRTC